MTKYYKGTVVNVKEIPIFSNTLTFIKTDKHNKPEYHFIGSSLEDAHSIFNKYSSNDLEKMIKLIKKMLIFKANDEEKKFLLNEMRCFKEAIPMYSEGKELIYEIMYDKNGKEYAKEIVSGCVFPIKTKYDTCTMYFRENRSKKICYDMDDDTGYFCSGEELTSTCTLFGINHKDVRTTRASYEKIISGLSKVNPTLINIDGKCHYMINSSEEFMFNVVFQPKMNFSNDQKIENVISTKKLASELDINNYLNVYETGWGKLLRRKNHINTMNKLSQSNYLGEIQFVNNSHIEKKRVNESNITKEMQELEFLLLKLKGISKEEYDKLNSEYLELLGQEDDELHLSSLSIGAIISLQSRVILAYMCNGGDSVKILSYLKEQVNKYIENINDCYKEKTEITIKDLDKICEHFLKSKNSYTIKEQNEILRCISLLYFFEMYENKDSLTSDDLKNSYIKDNIKRILIAIDVLYTEGVIKSVPNSLYDIDNLEELLNFIQRVEFEEKIQDNGEVLIKKIQQ